MNAGTQSSQEPGVQLKAVAPALSESADSLGLFAGFSVEPEQEHTAADIFFLRRRGKAWHMLQKKRLPSRSCGSPTHRRTRHVEWRTIWGVINAKIPKIKTEY